MFTIRKLFKFEAAHRLDSAYSKVCTDCIHGHSYRVELFISTKKLNSDGMVVDFGELKSVVGPLIDEWDHALIVGPMVQTVEKTFLERFNKKVVYLPWNPTAENMAVYLHQRLDKVLHPSAHLKVRVHETDTGWAEYEESK